ncbi:Regulator of chromosome condensation (RCC1) repeat protein [compost metagenome]
MKKTLLVLAFMLVVTSSFGQCWKSVAVGYANITAIAADGTLWAWGKNSNGELGDGTNVLKNSPVQIGTANDWKEVFAGMDGIYAFNLAIKTDGTLWAWGSNNRGQLGDGTTTSRNYPMQIGTDTDWKTAAAGLNHSIAIKENGTLWGWGCSEHFVLIGFPSGLNVLVPEQISPDTDWVQASAHDRVTVAVKTNHTVWGWGWNRNNMLNAPAGATIAGDVQYPAQKVLGTNIQYTSTGNSSSYDVKTNGILANSGDPLDHNPFYVNVADVGNNTLGIIKPNGTLWFEGTVLGTTSQTSVALTQLGTANNWVSVSVGSQCAAALNSNGELWTWGSNFHGGLGIGVNSTASSSTVPVLVPCPNVLDIPQQDSKVALQLYPNPVQNTLHVVSDSPIDRLVIIDALGKELYNQTFNTTAITIDSSQLGSGLYMVKVFSGTKQRQAKLVKN